MKHPSPEALDALCTKSIDVILTNQHSSGAYPASPTFSVYGYSWFRDGAFIADATSRVGEPDSATAFHYWCSRVMEARADLVDRLIDASRSGEELPAGQMLPTRFTLDGADGSEDWWDFQLDGYGTWLWTLSSHADRHNLDISPFQPSIDLTVDYLCEFGLRACFDWWEEFVEHRHTSTLGSIAAGLRAVQHTTSGERFDRAAKMVGEVEALINRSRTSKESLAKWEGNDGVDGSLLSVMVPFEVIQPGSALAEATYRQVVEDLLVGGVYRYRGDTFFGGGEWINLTAWLGWYESVTGRNELAGQRLAWIADQATPDGLLPEQVNGNTQFPDRIQEWVDRWGTVATPLLWSHAMFLTLHSVIGDDGGLA